MFVVYIIYSATLDRYYVGYTSDLELRLLQHNTGISVYTSKAGDWVVKHTESFDSREQAMAREREIKKKKSRKYIEGLIKELALACPEQSSGKRSSVLPKIGTISSTVRSP